MMSADGAAVDMRTLDGPLEGMALPTIRWLLGAEDVLISVWWLNGAPTAQTPLNVHFHVLKYLHDLLLEKAGVATAETSITAALATAIIQALGIVIEDRDGWHGYHSDLGRLGQNRRPSGFRRGLDVA
jgi:hypothetical protein